MCPSVMRMEKGNESETGLDGQNSTYTYVGTKMTSINSHRARTCSNPPYIQCDPEAAQAIFSNRVLAAKTTLIPLDLTHQVLATKDVQDRLMYGSAPRGSKTNITTPASRLRPMLHDLVMFFASTYADVYGLTSGPPLHDPVAVAAVLANSSNEDLGFKYGEGERWHVRVVTDGLHSNSGNLRGQVGRTVATIAPAEEDGVWIPRSLNVDRFWDLVESCIQRAERALGC